MGSKRSCQKQLRVQMKYVHAPDAQERLSRALDILLKAAARYTTTLGGSVNAEKQQPPYQPPEGDAPTGATEENNSHE